jgi:hypothetical protein
MLVRCTINGSQNQWFANDLFSWMPKANGPSRRNADGAAIGVVGAVVDRRCGRSIESARRSGNRTDEQSRLILG